MDGKLPSGAVEGAANAASNAGGVGGAVGGAGDASPKGNSFMEGVEQLAQDDSIQGGGQQPAQKPMSKNERNIQNNAQTLRNAADVAIATKNPYAMAAGGAVKVADKLTGGKSSEMVGKTINRVNKIVPGGRKVQRAINGINESGLGDKAGKVAGFVGGARGGMGGAAGAANAGKAAGAAGAAGGASKASGAASGAGNAAGGASSGAGGSSGGLGGGLGGLGGGKSGGLLGGKSGGLLGGGKSDDKGEGSGAVKSGVAALWNKIPMSLKLKIIGGALAVFAIVILMAGLVALINNIFLSYSDDVNSSGDVPQEYEEYWNEFCGDGADDELCSPEQIQANKELAESQKKFYEKLDSLAKKYKIDKEERYMVLATIFYGYSIDDFTEGQGAYELDEDDEINYDVSGDNIYKREKDSLKELIKQFQVNVAQCTSTYTNSNNETVTDTHPMYNSQNEPFVFGWWDKFWFFCNEPNDDEWKTAAASCRAKPNGKVTIVEATDNAASKIAFYKYLRESDYLDTRPQLLEQYIKYADSHHLPRDPSQWPDEDRITVRNDIIDDIKDIVEAQMDESGGSEFVAKPGKSYWWPIGSKETTTENGVEFASGDPEFTTINSHWGMRVHPISHQYKLHDGIDLHGLMGSTNIIASMGGEVITVVDGCASENSNGCGGGYGNYIEILDTKGNINLYAHMYKGSQTVSVGDKVSQGQVIGKVGSSGNSTGQHLHFTIRVNGQSVNPLDYIDPNNPRPSGSSSVDFNHTSYSREEFDSHLKSYYSQANACINNSGCEDFKKQILNNDAALTIYDVATSKNLNPELVVARSMLEGYSPGTYFNYFGYTCYNTGGLAACTKFTSFKSAMEAFFNNISQYDSVESMMRRYANLGQYWYTGTDHWAWGGCTYASYIYPDGIPDRVVAACNHPDGYCTIAGESVCTPTTEEDQEAYTQWQVLKMAETIDKVFG